MWAQQIIDIESTDGQHSERHTFDFRTFLTQASAEWLRAASALPYVLTYDKRVTYFLVKSFQNEWYRYQSWVCNGVCGG